jgi:hypothetical protein
MSIYFRLVIFTIACLGFIGLFAPMSSAQVARTELHAIPTLTLSDRQFLTGDKNGTPVTIAGVLRIPRLGTDRLPAVILVHGSGGIGGNVDRWSQELNSIGLATFVTDSFTARGDRRPSTQASSVSSECMARKARHMLLMCRFTRLASRPTSATRMLVTSPSVSITAPLTTTFR